MSQYSDMKASKLLNDIRAAKNELNSNNVQFLFENLVNDRTVLFDYSRLNLDLALDNIYNNSKCSSSFKNVQSDLNILESACTCVTQIHFLEDEIRELEKRRWKMETFHETITEYDLNGKPYEKTRTYEEKVEDANVVNQINEKLQKIKELESEINTTLG